MATMEEIKFKLIIKISKPRKATDKMPSISNHFIVLRHSGDKVNQHVIDYYPKVKSFSS